MFLPPEGTPAEDPGELQATGAEENAPLERAKPLTSPPVVPPPSTAAVPEPTPQTSVKAPPPKGVKLYLSTELDDALARRCYRDRSKNRSAHVRAALESYLAEDLAAIRQKQD